MKIIRILSSLLACALLLTGAAAAQETVTPHHPRDGVKQTVLANPGTEAVGARKAGCHHRRIFRL